MSRRRLLALLASVVLGTSLLLGTAGCPNKSRNDSVKLSNEGTKAYGQKQYETAIERYLARGRRELRAELHLHLLRQDAGFHHQRTTGELVAEHVRRLIFTGTLRPGDRIPQAEVAEDLGVSRLPVREAVIVELGPVNASIHQVNERVRADDLGALAAVYLGILERLLVPGAP